MMCDHRGTRERDCEIARATSAGNKFAPRLPSTLEAVRQ